MSTSEKFCLRWNDYQENVNTAFRDLRKDCDFADVTLACEDGQQVEAHKVILSASSPFFQKLLKKNKHEHPLIYMRGMTSENLLAIVDFLYYGEADIYQKNLDTFLNIAEEFQLQGLNGTEGEDTTRQSYFPTDPNIISNFPTDPSTKSYFPTEPSTNSYVPTDPSTKSYFPTNPSTKSYFPTDPSTNDEYDEYISFTNNKDVVAFDTSVALSKHEFSVDMKALDKKIDSLMCKGENKIKHGANLNEWVYVCKVCGKEDRKCNLKGHIERNHIEGINIPCNLCEKTFTSRDSRRMHNTNVHRDRN